MTFIHDFFYKKANIFFRGPERWKEKPIIHVSLIRLYSNDLKRWKIAARIIFWKRMQKSALKLNQYHTRIFLCKVTFSSLSISISSVFFKHVRSNFLLKISYHNSESRVQVIFLKQVKILSLPWKKKLYFETEKENHST